jgi:FixJ family two-component response regulator
MSTREPIVFLLDPNEESRRTTIALVASVGFKTQSFASPRTFLNTYDPDWPGCLISDIPMPEINGLDVQKHLIKQQITLPIIFLTAFGDIATAVEALKMGAFDFLEKPARPQILLDCIYRAVAHDEAQRKIQKVNNEIQKRYQTLTSREKEVMKYVVEGFANKVIAIKMQLSQKTVEFHRANVMNKMKADSLAELIHITIQLQQPRESPRLFTGLRSLTNGYHVTIP